LGFGCQEIKRLEQSSKETQCHAQKLAQECERWRRRQQQQQQQQQHNQHQQHHHQQQQQQQKQPLVLGKENCNNKWAGTSNTPKRRSPDSNHASKNKDGSLALGSASVKREKSNKKDNISRSKKRRKAVTVDIFDDDGML
jgi:hypothetical protein